MSENSDVAVAGCTRIIDAAPNAIESANAYYNRGIMEWKAFKNDAALADYNRTIKLAPNNDFALHNRAIIYDARGDYTAAITDYTAAIKANPIGGHFYNRGRTYFRAGKYREAADDFTVTTASWSHGRIASYPFAARCRALTARMVLLDDASSDCEKAISINDADPAILIVRAFVKFRQKDFKGVIADATAALSMPPRNPHDEMPLLDVGKADAYFLRGLAGCKLGQQTTCIRDLDAAVTEDPALEARYAKMGVAR